MSIWSMTGRNATLAYVGSGLSLSLSDMVCVYQFMHELENFFVRINKKFRFSFRCFLFCYPFVLSPVSSFVLLIRLNVLIHSTFLFKPFSMT